MHYECLLRFSRCSVIAVAAAGLLLPEGFSRCCPQRATDPAATRAEPAAILGLRRLVDLGATRIDTGQGEVSWVAMADPDGREFCVLTPR